MASIFKRKGGKRWIVSWFDHKGDRQEQSSGTTDKRLAERIAAAFSDKELERVRGLVDPAAEALAAERTRPLAAHIADYQSHLETLQRDDRHVQETIRQLRKLAGALGWDSLIDLDAGRLAAHLSQQAELRGTGARTYNSAATAWRAFGRWCVRANRLASNPLASMSARNLEGDRRRVRRDLTPDELARVIEAATRSPSVLVEKPVRNSAGERRMIRVRMNYPERVWAYRIASGTGFRAGEVASLTRESFDLDADTPTVTVEAAYSKRKRRDVQPIRTDLANLLRPWLASKAPGEPVCPLPDRKAALLVRADMDAARTAWIDESRTPAERAERAGSDYLRHTDSAGRVVDFHGLRVHYISRVVDAGANVKEAMELARHSDPKLTLKTYARVGMFNLAKVLDGMPNADASTAREPEAMKATGTDGGGSSRQNQGPQKGPHSGPHSPHGLANVSAARRGEPGDSESGSNDRKGYKLAGLHTSARHSAAEGENTGEGSRTPNLLIRSQVLYPIELRPLGVRPIR